VLLFLTFRRTNYEPWYPLMHVHQNAKYMPLHKSQFPARLA
jgi:hypothetical protein